MATRHSATDRDTLLQEADAALTSLSPREELLLRLRFGIGGSRQSSDAIARRFGLRPEDLRSLEERALTHLRQHAISAELSRNEQQG